MTGSLSVGRSLKLLYRQTDKHRQPVPRITGPLLEPNCAKNERKQEGEMERKERGRRERMRLIGMHRHFLHCVDEAELAS